MASQKTTCCALLAILLLIGAILGLIFGLRARDSNDKGIDIASTGDGNPVTGGEPTSSPLLPTSAPTKAGTVSPSAIVDPAMLLTDMLMSLSPSGDGSEFTDASSPQSQALAWVSNTTSVDQYSQQQVIQRYVLATFFYSTNGVENPFSAEVFGAGADLPLWTNSENWLTATGECEWVGVGCDVDGNVTEIDLEENGLTGSLPRELVLIKDSLQELDLRYNFIYSDFDAESPYWSQLINMKSLLVGYNYFVSDGIPAYFAQWTKLESMDISYTIMHGDLRPEVWANLVNLEYLEAGGNFYNTSLPSELYLLPSLTNLYMDSSGLEGNLDFLSEMDAIFEVWIDNNMLSGTLPPSLSSTLESISVTGNALTGTIPTEYSELVGMQQFWVYDNMLTGTIPEGFGDFERALVLQFEENEFSGQMPVGICTLKNLTLNTLTADCSGDIPELECTCCDCCQYPCFGR